MTDPAATTIPTIIILDTHPVLRMGLAVLLREKFDHAVLMEAKNVDEFRQSDVTTGPQLFILVVNSDFEEDGYSPVTELKTHYPNAWMILYGEQIKPELVISYLKSGANGYLSKHNDLTELVTCINAVIGGMRYISAGHKDFLLEYLIENYKSSKKQDLLTPRQNEVARYLIQGLSTTSIAEKTGLHISTISTFKTAIFTKLGIDNILKLKQILEGEGS